MTGTWINVAAILLGGSLGLALGTHLSGQLKDTVTASVGLFTLGLGIKLFLDSENILIVLGSVLIGALLGEWQHLEERLESLGARLDARFNRQGDSSRFIQGFLTASLLFAIGPMAILGAIQDGLAGDATLLIIKSVMDGFTSLAFASSLGVGVLFSSLVILVYQGGISLLAGQLQQIVTPAMMLEMQAAGGVLLMGLALSSLLEIKKIRVGNLLPALAVAPALTALLDWIKGLFF